MNQPDSIDLWQIDAFSDKPFSGNPAAVAVLPEFPDANWMQAVATEMNLSETAFVVPTGDANEFHLRWFTPKVEVDLCGHATLAATHALIEQGRVASSASIRFQTRSGVLTCGSRDGLLTMDFPATPPSQPVDPSTLNQLEQALGVKSEFAGLSREDAMVAVANESVVREATPDFGQLGQVQVRGIILTSVSSQPGIDFVSRFFSPRFGINEDPVTGSAHCCLAPYWAEQLGHDALTGFQASPRGGTVHMKTSGDRVILSGNAVTVMEAKLKVSPQKVI